jgi:hypothetical protein
MTTIPHDANPNVRLTTDSFDAAGTPIGVDAEVTLVVQARNEAQSWLESKKWILLHQDADILYQSPRPLSVWENTYIQEPNVTRFTVLKLTNSVSSAMSKGLFYEDPPILLRPLPGTNANVVRWKTAVMGSLIAQMELQREVDLGLDQFTLLGTTVFKLTVGKKRICTLKRKASVARVAAAGQQETIPLNEAPQITEEWKTVTCPTFEMLDIAGDVVEGRGGDILVDPKLAVPDIRCANWKIHRRFVTYQDLLDLAVNEDYIGLRDGDTKDKDGATLIALEEDGDYKGRPKLAAEVKAWFFPPAETSNTTSISGAQGNIVHHAQAPTDLTSNPLEKRLELLEYLNQRTMHVITVLNEAKVIRSGDATDKIWYFSANYWNRRQAWLGIGIGLVAGQDQRVEQGTLNAALKVLSMTMNTGYAMESSGGQPQGMVRTGLGKIWTVSDIAKMPKLLETVKVDPAIWQVLAESRQSSESTTGADQTLVQGSSMGPRSSITRTKGGANLMASASATRLEGPLGRLIRQVLVPFFYALDRIIFRYMSDAEIREILGDKLGKEALASVDMQAYHDGRCEFDVLAGAALAAKQTMTQSLVILGEYVLNPQLQQFLAEVHGVYLDQLEFMKMVLTASEWGQGVAETLIKPLTAEMKQRMAQKNKPDPKADAALARDQMKYDAQSKLEDQKTMNRITRDVTVDSFRQTGETEAVTGEPGGAGFGQPAEGVEA